MQSPFYNSDHEAFRETVRRFVQKEIEPFASAWDEEGGFPRDLYRKAAEAGLLQLNFPEQYGGVQVDRMFPIVLVQELARAASGGVSASLVSHYLALPPIAHHASESVKRKVLPAVLSGEAIAALAITEPGGGSDVAQLRTRARRDGDCYIVDGEKTFISSGIRADYLTVAVRTGGPGMGGVSLLLIEGNTPGLTRTPLKKMGWLASDTATLHFDACRIPVENLIGAENGGFKPIAVNFNDERLNMAAGAIATAQIACEEALAWAQMRQAFGKRILDHQVIRHKLVDMFQRVAASQAYLEITAWRMDQGRDVVADLCMLKNQASQTLAHCASEAAQILGGASFLRGAKVERIYREVKVMAIAGGTEEIMKELAARQLGW
ncbi:MAG: acyl-CoA dehydrogenase family protein [Beijerinckiaceae bacterium]